MPQEIFPHFRLVHEKKGKHEKETLDYINKAHERKKAQLYEK